MKKHAWLWLPLLLLATVVAAFVAGADTEGKPNHRADDPGVSEPVVIHKVSPTYPEEARKAKVQGTVVLQVVVEKDGSVGPIEVLENPDPTLSQAAMEAVKQWRYQPAHLEDGTIVAVYMELTVKFALN